MGSATCVDRHVNVRPVVAKGAAQPTRERLNVTWNLYMRSLLSVRLSRCILAASILVNYVSGKLGFARTSQDPASAMRPCKVDTFTSSISSLHCMWREQPPAVQSWVSRLCAVSGLDLGLGISQDIA